MSARSATQLLSIKDGCTFPFLNFLIIDLCNSSDNYLLDIISFFIAPPDVLLSKNLSSIEASPG